MSKNVVRVILLRFRIIFLGENILNIAQKIMFGPYIKKVVDSKN